jgi:hypothetical protein
MIQQLYQDYLQSQFNTAEYLLVRCIIQILHCSSRLKLAPIFILYY